MKETWTIKTQTRAYFHFEMASPGVLRLSILKDYVSSLHFGLSVLLCFLLLSPADVIANKCIVGGVYFYSEEDSQSYAQKSTLVNSPETGTLQDVGEKMCGYNITSEKFLAHGVFTVNYVAVSVEKNSSDQFCHVGMQHAVCVCPFYGCNSLTGAFFDTLIYHWKQGNVEGLNFERLSGPGVEMDVNRIFRSVKALTPGGGMNGRYDPFLFRDSPILIPYMKKRFPRYFPNETRKQELIREGNSELFTTTHLPSTTTITTTTAATTTTITTSEATRPPSEVSDSKLDGKSTSASGEVFSTTSMAIIVVLVVVIVLMAVFIIVDFTVMRKKPRKARKGESKKTSGTESKSGDHNSPKKVAAQPSSEPSPTNNTDKIEELLTRPADDMDTINACKSDWSTMGGLTNATQVTKF